MVSRRASISRQARTARQARLGRAQRRLHDNDILFRIAGDTIALTPPLIISEDQVGELVEKVGKVIRTVA